VVALQDVAAIFSGHNRCDRVRLLACGPYSDAVPTPIDELRVLSPEQKARLHRHPDFSSRFDYAIDNEALPLPPH
jgi:hypothetical protein